MILPYGSRINSISMEALIFINEKLTLNPLLIYDCDLPDFISANVKFYER